MIDFKSIEIDDKQWIGPMLAAADLPGSQYNFTNLFAWAGIFNYRIALVAGFLVVKAKSLDGIPSYLYPVGKGDIQTVIELMVQDAATQGHELLLAGLSTENMAGLDRIFPGQYQYTGRRDAFDYVYLLDHLVNLTGGKLSSKRNHVNQFKKKYLWSFEPISSENIDACREMDIEWCKAHDCMYNFRLANENCAVHRCFDHFAELGLEGGLIRADGRIVAFTMGDRLNADTYDIHIEKAFEEITGAYQMINHEFAVFIKQNHPEIIYVNREEDMGQAGLRKAKLSYNPVRMEEKYWAKAAGERRLTRV